MGWGRWGVITLDLCMQLSHRGQGLSRVTRVIPFCYPPVLPDTSNRLSSRPVQMGQQGPPRTTLMTSWAASTSLSGCVGEGTLTGCVWMIRILGGCMGVPQSSWASPVAVSHDSHRASHSLGAGGGGLHWAPTQHSLLLRVPEGSLFCLYRGLKAPYYRALWTVWEGEGAVSRSGVTPSHSTPLRRCLWRVRTAGLSWNHAPVPPVCKETATWSSS